MLARTFRHTPNASLTSMNARPKLQQTQVLVVRLMGNDEGGKHAKQQNSPLGPRNKN